MTEAMKTGDAAFQHSGTEIDRKMKGLGLGKKHHRRRRFGKREFRKNNGMSSMISTVVTSAETVAEIEELLIEILICLPALSLLRFKTVSKHWLSLISDPEFQRGHSLRNPNPKVSAFFSCGIEERFFKSIPLSCPSGNPFKTITSSNVNSLFHWSKSRILQSCNGLFLCYIETSRIKDRRNVYVVNPTTNKFHALCAPSLEKNSQDRYSKFLRYALAFDPSKSPYYMVVCVTNIRDDWDYDDSGYHHVDIYSSMTGTWEKRLEVPFLTGPPPLEFETYMHFDSRENESAVYGNGAIHWIRGTNNAALSFSCSRKEWIRNEWDVLHYFDINKECLRVAAVTPPVPSCLKNSNIPLAANGEGPSVWSEMVQRCFGESSGRLYLIETYTNCYTQVLDVMEMEKDYSGWTVKYHVDLNRVIGLASGRKKMKMNGFIVLGLFQNEGKTDDDDDSSTDLWLHIPRKVVSYNCRSDTLKTIGELADEHVLPLHDNYAYKGSLAFV